MEQTNHETVYNQCVELDGTICWQSSCNTCQLRDRRFYRNEICWNFTLFWLIWRMMVESCVTTMMMLWPRWIKCCPTGSRRPKTNRQATKRRLRSTSAVSANHSSSSFQASSPSDCSLERDTFSCERWLIDGWCQMNCYCSHCFLLFPQTRAACTRDHC